MLIVISVLTVGLGLVALALECVGAALALFGLAVLLVKLS